MKTKFWLVLLLMVFMSAIMSGCAKVNLDAATKYGKQIAVLEAKVDNEMGDLEANKTSIIGLANDVVLAENEVIKAHGNKELASQETLDKIQKPINEQQSIFVKSQETQKQIEKDVVAIDKQLEGMSKYFKETAAAENKDWLTAYAAKIKQEDDTRTRYYKELKNHGNHVVALIGKEASQEQSVLNSLTLANTTDIDAHNAAIKQYNEGLAPHKAYMTNTEIELSKEWNQMVDIRTAADKIRAERKAILSKNQVSINLSGMGALKNLR